MNLEPARVVRQQRVRGGVRLVEAVARELLHQVEYLVGLVLRNAVGLERARAEFFAVLGHLLELFLAHGAAQQVGAAKRVAAQDLRGLHHLLLVDHDPVGLGEHFGHGRVRVLHLFAAVLARHKARNQVHRARPVQRVERNQVFKARGPCVLQHALHAAAFKLEHRFRLALGKQLVGFAVVQPDVLVREVLLPLVALDDELFGNLENGERGQAQKVELHEADGLHVVLVVLAHGRVAAGLLVQRAKIGELAGRNQHAARVHADVAGHALELLRKLHQHAHFFFLLDTGRKLRLHLDGVIVLVALHLRLGRVLDGDRLARLVRNELADAVAEHVAHVQHAAHVANGGACGHGSEGGDLAHGLAAVFGLHVVDHPVAVALAEVDVEVGHRNALGVQEPFEQQLVFERIRGR